MPDIEKIKVGEITYDLADAVARDDINELTTKINNYAKRVFLTNITVKATYDAPETTGFVISNKAKSCTAYYRGGMRFNWKNWQCYPFNAESTTVNLPTIPKKNQVNHVLLQGFWFAHYYINTAGMFTFGVKLHNSTVEPATANNTTDPSGQTRCKLYSPQGQILENTGPISKTLTAADIQSSTNSYHIRHACGGPAASMGNVTYCGLVINLYFFGGDSTI